MSTPDAGSDEPGEWPGQGRPARPPRPAGAVPPARRNQERRARRAARVRTQREERRRREIERRRRERERLQRERDDQVAREAFAAAALEPEPPAWQPPQPDPWQAPPPVDDWSPPPAPVPGMNQPAEPVRDPVAFVAPAPRAPETSAASVRRVPSKAGRATRRRLTVRRVDPWSVFRLSLVLYFCLLVVVTLGLVIFWLVLSRLPLLQRTLEVIEQLGIPIDPGLVLTILVPVGLLNVLLWSGANLFFAVLYNLVADLVGGLRVTVGEEP